MQDYAANQIEQIHSMLATGHRSVRLERHSLILWGLTAASLILIVNAFITPERFPVRWQRSLAANSFIAIVVWFIAFWDFRLTRLKRESRDETLSFVQLQLTKVWWFLLGLIILINIGMNFFGGGYLFYPIMIILVGLGFYIHGLFSQQLLAWNGLLMVFAGLASILLQTPLETMEWFTVMLFGFGLPVLAWLIDMPLVQQQMKYRLLSSIAWLCLIVAPTLFINNESYKTNTPDWPIVTLQQYQQRTDTDTQGYVVKIPAGTVIPLEVDIRGNGLAGHNRAVIPLKLEQRMSVAVLAGKPDGRYRLGDGEWLKPRVKFRVTEFDLESQLTQQEGAKLNLNLFLKTEK